MTTASPAHSEKWPLDVDAPRRFHPARPGRFSPVTEADLQRDRKEVVHTPREQYRPHGWRKWQIDRVNRDLAVIRGTRWETR